MVDQQTTPKTIDLLSNDHDATQTNFVNMEMAQPPNFSENPSCDSDDLSMAESIASSVLTADGIHDVTGFNCICLVILIGDMSRGVMFPSMWPLVENIGGSTVLLGYSVAAFSFGRILVNPVFGSWSHQIGYRKTLIIAACILFVGTLLYGQIQNIGKPEFLIVAQTILGIGSGTLGVTRAFVAEVTAKRNRTTYIAWITAVQYAGFTVTPFFGAFFNWYFQDSEYKVGLIRLNMFTAPAYFMSFIVAATLFVLVYIFKDRQRIEYTKGEKKSAKRMEIEDIASSMTPIGMTVYDCCILGCMLLNVSTKGSIASFETLGISIAQSHFDMMASKAAVVVATCGLVGVFSLLSMGKLSARFNDVQLISGGMVFMAIGIASLDDLKKNIQSDFSPSWRYVVAMFMIYAIGYPIGHTAVIGLFSKSKYACRRIDVIDLSCFTKFIY